MFGKIRYALFVLLTAATLLLAACDNGGTIRPDAGCIGQGQSWDTCADNLGIERQPLIP